MVSDIHLIAIRFGTLFINLYFKIQMHVLVHASILDKKKKELCRKKGKFYNGANSCLFIFILCI